MTNKYGGHHLHTNPDHDDVYKHGNCCGYKMSENFRKGTIRGESMGMKLSLQSTTPPPPPPPPPPSMAIVVDTKCLKTSEKELLERNPWAWNSPYSLPSPPPLTHHHQAWQLLWIWNVWKLQKRDREGNPWAWNFPNSPLPPILSKHPPSLPKVWNNDLI